MAGGYRGWETWTPPTAHSLPAPATASKYRNEKTGGFDSKKEAQRFHELTLTQKAGLIRDLACQVDFDLYPCNGERVAGYRADFTYWDITKQQRIVEDVKGGEATKTRLYQLKKKLLRAQGIDILEV